MQYQLITYDVWGDKKQGWEVNQAFTTDIMIELDDNPSDRTINRRLGIQGVHWEGDGYTYYGQHTNGRPAYELRLNQN